MSEEDEDDAEDDNNNCPINVEAIPTKIREDDINNPSSNQVSPSSSRQSCLKQSVSGHIPTLILTMASGFGVLLGILVANILGNDNPSWRYEYKNMLQLLISILFAVGMVTFCIGFRSLMLFVSNKLNPKCNDKNNNQAQPQQQQEMLEDIYLGNNVTMTQRRRSKVAQISTMPASSTRKPINQDENHHDIEVQLNDDIVYKSDNNNNRPLIITFGKRPNIQQIIEDTKARCIDQQYTSVGVSVCGPESLVDTVISECGKASSSSSSSFCQCFPSSLSGEDDETNNVQFVVDDENFDL